MPIKQSALLSKVTEVFPWASNEYALGIFVARRIVKTLKIGSCEYRVGWVHDPVKMNVNQVALGIFTDKKRFAPVAVVDSHARIYEANLLDADISDLEPRVIVAREGLGHVHEYRFLRENPTPSTMETMAVEHGAVVARSEDGRLRWLSSWLKTEQKGKEYYTFEQVRSSAVSTSETANLEFRDAMCMAYFVIYAQPTLATGLVHVTGFGTSNIYRRIRQQAPLSAIRSSVNDINNARSAGLKISGLEEYFLHAMRESGALDRIAQLEATHGQENLELMTNPKSHLYYLHSRNGVDFESALKTLRIESNLNRFSAVSSVIENNYHFDFTPTEDFISLAYAAKLSSDLLENPAFDALSTLDTHGVEDSHALPSLRYATTGSQATQETSFASSWLGQFYAKERQSANNSSQTQTLHNIKHVNAVFPMVKAARETAYQIAAHNDVYASHPQLEQEHGIHTSQWVYRRALAKLIAHLRLPLRSDIDFRADVEHTGATVIDFTSTASTVMPTRRFDPQKLDWVDMSETERQQMSSRYNLRVGIILAALAFGASDHISRVAVRIDNLDGSQDIEDRDPTMYALLMRALDSMGMDNPHHAHSSRNSKSTNAEANSSASVSGETSSNFNDTFMDIMQSANFSQDQLAAFEAHDAQPSEDDIRLAFEEVTREGRGDAQSNAEESTGPHVSVMSAPGTDPLELIRRTALTHTVAAVVFEREQFMQLLEQQGLEDPYAFYHAFELCSIDVNDQGVLQPIETALDLRDALFTPQGAQDEPEVSRALLSGPATEILGGTVARDLSIQRSDVLERAQEDIAAFATAENWSVPQRAQKISEYIDEINDPELNEYKESYVRSVIDGTPIDRTRFTLSQDLDAVRTKSRETFMGGNPSEALEMIEKRLQELDAAFKAGNRVPVYFNSYAERVVYNHLFAMSDKKLVLIPDNLFQTHMEMVEVYSHIGRPDTALRHLNTAVSYAPSYPLPHLRLAIALADNNDWKSSFAAASNALHVALDKDDAAYAYYRMAYAAWMQDDFEIAASCYVMSIRISESTVPHARQELDELVDRARSQDISLPLTFDEATDALAYFDIDIWPFTQAASLMGPSATVAVDNNLFVAGRTLAAASARIRSAALSMDNDNPDLDDVVEIQFLRSLNA
ncbi:tetratricopeptide repeat protein [Alloscardovia omnicolens]|uniref:tetratricopeptide repeat protein n=1 Tax=Alloscardovia omnicolens TaxID=419015 RepID=UPI003A5E970F